MPAYNVIQLDEVAIAPGAACDGMDLMSPYVWKEDGRYRAMVRAVPRPLGPDDPTGIIVAGHSDDGLRFAMDKGLAIAPGPQPHDAGGVEDPTVVPTADGYLVYYTGVDKARAQSALILATGPTLEQLTKRRVELQAPPGEGNIKEATLVQSPAGDWRIFYEYAANDASRIGMASGPSATGPWTVLPDPFTVREDGWDNWHLSTGPIIDCPKNGPVMFYNGATHDARWRIGWVCFSADYTSVTARGIEPLIMPPPAPDRSATDIAFAASTVIEGDRIALYYSLEDRMLRRALIDSYA